MVRSPVRCELERQVPPCPAQGSGALTASATSSDKIVARMTAGPDP